DVRLLSSWLDFPVNSSLMPLADSQLHSLNVTVPIDKVHGEGLLHRGAWIAVLRKPALHSSGPLEILLLRRGLHLKTCPGGWSLVGEHANLGEEWRSIVLRALREELTLDVDDLRPVDLTPGHSLLVKTAQRSSSTSWFPRPVTWSRTARSQRWHGSLCRPFQQSWRMVSTFAMTRLVCWLNWLFASFFTRQSYLMHLLESSVAYGPTGCVQAL
ncbi:unnamed protein product, partial [Polarella glacialis]